MNFIKLHLSNFRLSLFTWLFLSLSHSRCFEFHAFRAAHSSSTANNEVANRRVTFHISNAIAIRRNCAIKLWIFISPPREIAKREMQKRIMNLLFVWAKHNCQFLKVFVKVVEKVERDDASIFYFFVYSVVTSLRIARILFFITDWK